MDKSTAEALDHASQGAEPEHTAEEPGALASAAAAAAPAGDAAEAEAAAAHAGMALRAVLQRVEAAVALRNAQRSAAAAAAATAAAAPAAAAAAAAAPACRLVAVSKTQPASALLGAFAAGHRHFGENYVQELVAKNADAAIRRAEEEDAEAAGGAGGGAGGGGGAAFDGDGPAAYSGGGRGPVRWHFIGGLQSNKCKALVAGVPGLWVVESVDSAKLATLLDRAVAAADAAAAAGAAAPRRFAGPLRVLVQVNTSGEPQKGGCEAGSGEAAALARHIREQCPRLRFRGLMTIGRLGEAEPACFERLVREREAVRAALALGAEEAAALELSMGMSGDFELAVAHGSSSVRVGSAIFGARPAKPQAAPA